MNSPDFHGVYIIQEIEKISDEHTRLNVKSERGSIVSSWSPEVHGVTMATEPAPPYRVVRFYYPGSTQMWAAHNKLFNEPEYENIEALPRGTMSHQYLTVWTNDVGAYMTPEIVRQICDETGATGVECVPVESDVPRRSTKRQDNQMIDVKTYLGED